MPHSMNLSEIKTNIKQIIVNLQNLEQFSNSPVDNLDIRESHELQCHTATLLAQLEELPSKKITSLQRQRKRRRQRVKEKCKLQKEVNKYNAKYLKDKEVIRSELLERKPQLLPEHKKQAPHIILKKQHDANEILQTFDLLERLNKARGGDNADLSRKLSRMRTVWQRVKQETASTNDASVSANLEQHWDQVLFGSSSAPLQPRRGEKKKNIRELLQRRFTWDSYICNDSSATSIPIGWVLPPYNPLAVWRAFQY